MSVVSMKALLETGVHFGHRTSKWNPRMKSYIFTERNDIHIIDLQQTMRALDVAYELVRSKAAEGGKLLFVGTKRQAQETMQVEAERCGMPYVNCRWLGGTLTNWSTIRSRISELERLEHQRDEGIFERLTKKEALTLERKIDRLEGRLGGIRHMQDLPDMIFVVDVRREETAIHEANLLNLPVVALVDTNCDPSGIDYVIPSNDDAIRAIKLLTSKMADAVLEGKALHKEQEQEEEALSERREAEEPIKVSISDDELLGAATLAKLKSGVYDESNGQPASELEAPSERKAEDQDKEVEVVSLEVAVDDQNVLTQVDEDIKAKGDESADKQAEADDAEADNSEASEPQEGEN